MSEFEKWFEDQDFYTNMRFIHGDKLFDKDGGAYRVLPVQMTYLAWLVGRAAIQEMDEVIKLQDADLRKYEKQIEGLKAQLNNMETCYIEKKKELEELRGRFNFLLDKNIRNESEHASLKIRVTHVSHLMDKAAESGTECVDIGCLYDALIKGGDLDEALRGES